MKELKKFLDKHDGGCCRDGEAINYLALKSGYSIESLRSLYYGRREACDEVRKAKLLAAIDGYQA